MNLIRRYIIDCTAHQHFNSDRRLIISYLRDLLLFPNEAELFF